MKDFLFYTAKEKALAEKSSTSAFTMLIYNYLTSSKSTSVTSPSFF